jgi:hypothetical protein
MPQLSIVERNRRWQELRKRMLLARIDCLICLGNDIYYDMGTANLRYLFQVGGKISPYGAFSIDRDPILWNSVPHIRTTITCRSRIGSATSASSVAFRPSLPSSASGALIADASAWSLIRPRWRRSLCSNTRWIRSSANFRIADFVDASWIIEEMRIVKSEEEIDLLRNAGAIARKVIDTLLVTARPGVREAEVFAEMVRTQIAHGAEPNVFHLFNSGPIEHPPSELWHLLHGVEQPQVPSMRPLADGDLFISEYHTKYGCILATLSTRSTSAGNRRKN